MAWQAASYRQGRVLLAGDAAHVRDPVGGQGLQIGMQAAVNLGWKLARVVKGVSLDSLLDTYHAGQYPGGDRVLRNRLAQVALLRSDDGTNALRGFTSELLSMDEPCKRVVAMMSGLDIRYDLGERLPLPERRMPDLDAVTADGPRRASSGSGSRSPRRRRSKSAAATCCRRGARYGSSVSSGHRSKSGTVSRQWLTVPAHALSTPARRRRDARSRRRRRGSGPVRPARRA
jgi:hypothetical protein